MLDNGHATRVVFHSWAIGPLDTGRLAKQSMSYVALEPIIISLTDNASIVTKR